MILTAKGFFQMENWGHWLLDTLDFRSRIRDDFCVYPSRKMMKTGFHSEKEWNPVLKR